VTTLQNGHGEKARLAEPTPPTQQAFPLHTSIEELATVFADALPEAVFSLADIQGSLLTQTKDSLRAVLEVWSMERWEIAAKQT
jgi:hypothetical protein